MTYHQAHNLLDQAREGASIPESVITRALELTGDVAEDELIKLLAEVEK